MRICLVASEILGAHKNGGIGTVTSHLGVLLAHEGHDVTLFNAGENRLDTADPWAGHYREAGMAVIEHYYPEAPLRPDVLRPSVQIFEQIRRRDFDVILFQEYLALGYASVVAKRCGLAFERTVLAAIAHSSTPWLRQANRMFPTRPDDLILDHLEQRQIELSDALVSPSTYLMDDMRRRGWNLPDDCVVLQHFLAGPERLGHTRTTPGTGRVERPRRLTFFGRLENRKGLNLFLAALETEPLKGRQFDLTFLGKEGGLTVAGIRRFLEERRPDLAPRAMFLTELSSDEAQNYLAGAPTVAVIPSLIDNSPCVIFETAMLRLPMVASAVGGIPEILAAKDCERVLFAPQPKALAAKLAEVLSAQSWAAPELAIDQEESGRRWLAWFRAQGARLGAGATPGPIPEEPDTTVLLPTGAGQERLLAALRALALQSDGNFRVLVVPASGATPESSDLMRRLGRGYPGLDLRVAASGASDSAKVRQAAAAAVDTPFVILLDPAETPFPNLVATLRRAIHRSQADAVTAQRQEMDQEDGAPDWRSLFDRPRLAFPSGPVAVGAMRDTFGGGAAICRTEIAKAFGSAVGSGGRQPIADLLARAALAGRTILSLPEPVSAVAEPLAASDHADLARMRALISERLPDHLTPLVDLLIGAQGAPR